MKNFWEILLYNIAFVGAWHVVAFVLCVYALLVRLPSEALSDVQMGKERQVVCEVFEN